MPCACQASAANRTQGPEVAGEAGREQILKRHCAIALHAPTRPPRIPDDENTLRAVVSDRHYAVATHHRLPGGGHRDHTRVGNLLAFETLVYRKTEYERITLGEAP